MSVFSNPTIDEQKQFWNWHWQNWADRKTINEWKQRRHETVLSFLASLSLDNAQILDVGCGPGKFTKNLTRYGQVTGIDLSEEAIKMAKSRFTDIKFMAGNIYDIPLSAGQFDVIVSQEVFDHVEDQAVFVARIAHALKPGGHFVLSCANKFVMDRVSDFPAQPPGHITRYLSRKQLSLLLSGSFSVLRSRTVIPLGNRGILRAINSRKLNAALSSLVSQPRLDDLKEKLGFGYQVIVLAQKKAETYK